MIDSKAMHAQESSRRTIPGNLMMSYQKKIKDKI